MRCTADSGENAVDGKQLLWMAAYKKGLVTERAMEVMREGVSFEKKIPVGYKSEFQSDNSCSNRIPTFTPSMNPAFSCSRQSLQTG